MNSRADVVLFVLAVLLAVLAGTTFGAAELATLAAAGPGIVAGSPHLSVALRDPLVDTPHLAAAAADTADLPAAQPAEVEITDHPKTPEELLARMARAREAIRTLDVTYSVTTGLDADALGLDAWLRSGISPPMGRFVRTSEHRLCIDGARWRWEERRGPDPVSPLYGLPQRSSQFVETCDGRSCRCIELQEGDLARLRRPARTPAWERILGGRPEAERVYSYGSVGPVPPSAAPEFHRFRPLSDFLQGFWVHPQVALFGRTALGPPESHGDGACYRFIVEIAAHRYTYYVRPDYGWAPVRMTLEIADPARPYLAPRVSGVTSPFPLDEQEWEIHYRQDGSGLWYPCEWTWWFYAGYGPGRQLAREIACVAESVVLNEPLADDLFTVEFPDGLPVHDLRRGATATWDSDLSPEELDRLFAAAARDETAAQLRRGAAERQRRAQMRIDPLEPAERAPTFELTALDGSQVALADMRGQWALLLFWNSADAACDALLPLVQALHERFAPTGRFQIIGLSTDLDPELLRAAVEEHGLSWPQVWLEGDDGRTVREAYAVKNVPRFFLIAPDGYVEAIPPNVQRAAEAVKRALATPDRESAQ